MELQMLAPADYRTTGDADPIQFYRLPLLGRLFAKRVTGCLSLLPTGRRVLEIGYGSGISFLNLAEKFEEIHGIDLHASADEVAGLFAKETVKPHLRQGSITDLPYEDDSFDAALAISIHEELKPQQQARAFAEVHRVVRPGGCYVVGVPGVNALMTLGFYALGCNIGKWHVSTERQVLAAMRETLGVDVVRYRPRICPKSLAAYVCMRGWKR